VFEGECLKDGLRNGAEASIPVRLAHRLLGRPSVGGVASAGSPQRPGSSRSAVYFPRAYCLIKKARSGFSGAGFILATMKICR
jgi:hypothetical protein